MIKTKICLALIMLSFITAAGLYNSVNREDFSTFEEMDVSAIVFYYNRKE